MPAFPGSMLEIENADTICVCFVEEVSAGRAAFTGRNFRAEGGRGKRLHLSTRKGRRERLIFSRLKGPHLNPWSKSLGKSAKAWD